MTQQLSPSTIFGHIPLLKLRVEWTTSPKAPLPHSLGSAWRGLVGWELRRLVCPFPKFHDCKECLIGSHCPYFLLFEQNTTFSGLADAPRGYILNPQPYRPNTIMTLDITLMGTCTRFFPVIRQTLLRAQTSGIGTSRNPFHIQAMKLLRPSGWQPLSLAPHDVPMVFETTPLHEWIGNDRKEPGGLQVEFLTPLRLRRKGRYLNALDLPFMLAGLARRLEAVDVIFNEGKSLGKSAWKALEENFSTRVEVVGELNWRDQSRYSNRQKKRVPQGGLVGKVTLPSVSPWLHWWFAAAEHVHVGKGASMGLGSVKIRSIGEGTGSMHGDTDTVWENKEHAFR